MPRKSVPKPKQGDPAQYKRFLETAKKVEADEDPKAFEKAFEKVTTPKPHSPKTTSGA